MLDLIDDVVLNRYIMLNQIIPKCSKTLTNLKGTNKESFVISKDHFEVQIINPVYLAYESGIFMPNTLICTHIAV